MFDRELSLSPDAAERAAQDAAIAAGGRNRMAKPPWLPNFQGKFWERLTELGPRERENFFCLMALEIARQQKLHDLGLLEPILAERAEKRAADKDNGRRPS